MKNNNPHSDLSIVRRLSGSMSAEESRQFDAAMARDPELQRDYAAMADLWHDTIGLQRAMDIHRRKDAVWQHIEQQTTHKIGRHGSVYRTLMRIAAVAVVLIAIGILLVLRGSGNTTEYTCDAMRDTVSLPDGTQAILNAGSRLAYSFDGTTRRAEMEGMVHFSVAHDKRHPFVVEADEATITVVGTQFTVENIDSRERVCVEVAQGRVEFSADNNTRMLLAGDMATWTGGLMLVSHHAPTTAAWVSGQITLRNASLSTVVDELLAYYPEIHGIRGSTADDSTLVTTTFDSLPLSDVLDELNIHFGKKMALDNGYLVISD